MLLEELFSGGLKFKTQSTSMCRGCPSIVPRFQADSILKCIHFIAEAMNAM